MSINAKVADKAAGERSLAERPQRLRKPMYIYEF